MNLEEKRELLLRWKQSGLSPPKWWKENADEMDLPHLSTLYAWAKQLGFSTEPGAEVTSEHNEDHEEQGEMGDSHEIGRASCRERVEITVEAAEVNG